ncbi:DEAD/DEAH box helicase [Ectobacillus ponti]|uniref:DEAD/DEAH box helicase n=1 Tax=Ectobacillus ponti TaxID=2961894 RepID=A0AA41X6P7_9BACI|nr:DEAD/DEAH box helicase [Ectobacillus ponti]MCP8967624.1 DEAD/DEAH box helicase [Ectobacillus ponti]
MHKLAGRQWFLDEGIPEELKDKVVLEQGLAAAGAGWLCNRCGNQSKSRFASFPCARCGKTCAYCRHCISMGRVSACTTLVRWSGEEESCSNPGTLVWEGTLSPGQKLASQAVVEAVQQRTSCLIWAVCGAGKTEMLFAGIAAALQGGQRVCLATPRTDVVLELAPRLREVFPHTPIAALYGGTPDHDAGAPLVIATTHQLFRYHRAFDTVILDEADAFPYSADATLRFALEGARRRQSAMVYLTATPNEEWKREVKRGKRKAVIIPARYHRHPLPVPSFAWCGDWQRLVKKGRLPARVLRWAAGHLQAKRPVFLFVPHIRYVELATAILQRLDERIAGVHAEDAQRKEKVAAFRRGDIPLLVTTTILERGVTVPNVQVAVMGAEDRLFTESALVQIAGRAGRNAKFPAGDVVFFHFGKTEAQEAAKRHIAGMNRQAKEMGLL